MTGWRRAEAADRIPRDFDGGRLGPLAWLGLVVAAVGWIVLIAVAAFADRWSATAAGRVPIDAMALAECLIGSGFALAVIGTLRTGFGALNRFFAAVLDRSASRVPSPEPEAQRAPAGMTDPAPRRHDYNILADGSVEVETIVGTRRFANMDEARDFL